MCNGVPADIGGCSAARPSFAATTCEGLAAEWGAAVDRRIVAIIDGPATVDGEQRSVLLSEAMSLASILVGQRMIELGNHESCDVANFLPIAKRQFSEDLTAGIGGILFDGNPIGTQGDWDVVLNRYIGIIDDDDVDSEP